RAVAGAGGAGRQHGMVVVADIALAHQQAWQVFERVFRIAGVDLLLDLRAGNAFDRGRDLGRQGSWMVAGDDDGAYELERRFPFVVGKSRRREDGQHGGGQGNETGVHDASFLVLASEGLATAPSQGACNTKPG